MKSCRGHTVYLVGGSALLAASGVALLMGLNTVTAYADPPPPFATTSSGVAATLVPTPTLPARFTLLSPAFALSGASGDLTLTYDWLPAGVFPLLAYRPNAAAPWQKIPVRVAGSRNRAVEKRGGTRCGSGNLGLYSWG